MTLKLLFDLNLLWSKCSIILIKIGTTSWIDSFSLHRIVFLCIWFSAKTAIFSYACFSHLYYTTNTFWLRLIKTFSWITNKRSILSNETTPHFSTSYYWGKHELYGWEETKGILFHTWLGSCKWKVSLSLWTYCRALCFFGC